MEVSGQLGTPELYLRGKSTQYPTSISLSDGIKYSYI
jgi:hypothetical protein